MEESEERDLTPQSDSERCQQLRKLSELKLYRRRWFFLGVVCLLNCSNAMIWISFAPVANIAASYFMTTLDTINWLSLVYLIISIPFGIGASWFLDTLGLKSAVILSSWLNMLGSFVRSASIIYFLNAGHSPLIYLFLGQSLCAIAQPLVIFVPAKLAAVWFPEHQRATANMIASMSNPVGILLANIISPAVVTEEKYIPLLFGIYGVPAVLACVLATGGIWQKAPPTPPSVSAVNPASEPFSSSLKALMKNKAYIILMLCFGAGLGIFTAFSAFLDQILCFKGYSNFFAGLCGALFILFGIFGALLCGLYVDRTKQFIEVVKICFCLGSFASIAFAVVSNMRNQAIPLGIICSLYGFFGFAAYPIAMELAVECSYPVGEGTSTGLSFISGNKIHFGIKNKDTERNLAAMMTSQVIIAGLTLIRGALTFGSQIQGLIYMLLFQGLTKPVASSSLSSCGVDQIEISDWSVSTLVMAALTCLASCVFVIFFHTDYKRLLREANTEDNEETERELES